ncbi:MAG: ABC-F family ATP-binding cassette domain-containing protein [Lachnospiraceae bacterium]
MNIFTIDHASKAFQTRQLLEDASFYLQEGEKVGVIGINGTGKSTLLKIIAGLESVDQGQVIKANNTVVRYLSQNPEFRDDMTVLEAVLQGNIRKENEWTVESDAKAMLTKLGVMDFIQPCGQLSGGQKKRLALVSALLWPAEILVLDEPTNHLDAAMSDWLEEQLKKYKGCIVMVTHDRYFLDAVANRIIEIDKGKIYNYNANYAGFLELKAGREDLEDAATRKRNSILRVELEWVKRGARARSTKQKARLERYEEMKNTSAPVRDGQVEMGSVGSRLGKSTIELQGVSKTYEEKKLISKFDYIFLPRDRVGFLGANGAGKSTLLKMIMGQVTPDTGSILIGPTVKIAYYAQEIGTDEMKPNQRVIDYIKEVAEYIETTEGTVTASKMLETFLFTGEMQYSMLGKLSGGERRRLYLCKILMTAPNVLILDEPTNDLDITTLTVLENYLDRFSGIVMVVSHDRYFMDRVVHKLFSFDKDGVLTQHMGGYTDYVNRIAIAEGDVEKPLSNQVEKLEEKTTQKWNAGRERKLKFTYQEQKDYDNIEEDIRVLEDKIEQYEADILKFATDFIKLRELTESKETSEAMLEEKMDRWMYLEELASKIANQ